MTRWQVEVIRQRVTVLRQQFFVECAHCSTQLEINRDGNRGRQNNGAQHFHLMLHENRKSSHGRTGQERQIKSLKNLKLDSIHYILGGGGSKFKK